MRIQLINHCLRSRILACFFPFYCLFSELYFPLYFFYSDVLILFGNFGEQSCTKKTLRKVVLIIIVFEVCVLFFLKENNGELLMNKKFPNKQDLSFSYIQHYFYLTKLIASPETSPATQQVGK